jgi:uncharacterized protein (TIGR03663 family)
MEGRKWNWRSAILRRQFAAFILLAGVALVLRVPRLGERPMHNDEAVNAIKFGQHSEHGAYKYDPNEHHGPSLYYATLAIARLTAWPNFASVTEAKLRLVIVLFGIGLIALLPLVLDGLGRRAALWAALFTAISPAMVFYSRYYIHELMLVFFGFLAMGAGWRYWRTRKVGWIVVAGGALGIMHATKETFIIAVAAAASALVLNHLWNRYLDASGLPVRAPRIAVTHLIVGLGVWVIVAVLLFSSFLTNAGGPLDSIRTYLPWLARAGGDSPHINPWHFYLHRLLFFHAAKGPIWSEAFIFILAIIGAAAAFVRKRTGDAHSSFVRFVAIYTFMLTAAYSLISYKTPWCLLGFWHGAILLAGVGAAVVVRLAKNNWAKFTAGALLVAGTLQLAAQAWQAAVPYASDQRNPYVYAHTSANILKLVDQVHELARASAEGERMVIKVIAPENDYWPLPWYFRRFNNVGCWDQLPADPFAPVMVVSHKLRAALDDKKTHLMVGYFQLRPPDTFVELYVELGLWKAYLDSKQSRIENRP